MRGWHYAVWLGIYYGFDHFARWYGFRGPSGWLITLAACVAFAVWVLRRDDRLGL